MTALEKKYKFDELEQISYGNLATELEKMGLSDIWENKGSRKKSDIIAAVIERLDELDLKNESNDSDMENESKDSDTESGSENESKDSDKENELKPVPSSLMSKEDCQRHLDRMNRQIGSALETHRPILMKKIKEYEAKLARYTKKNVFGR